MENEVKVPAYKYNYISRKEYLQGKRAFDPEHEHFDEHIIAARRQGNSRILDIIFWQSGSLTTQSIIFTNNLSGNI